VARTLGVSPGVAFLRTTLPLARRGVLAGLVMMWARGISEFGAVVILAYNPKIVPVLVYERFEGFGLDAAKPVAVIIVLVALAVFIVLRTALAPRLRVRRLRVAGAMPMPVGRSSLDGGSSDAPTDGLSQGGGSAMDGSGPAIGESTVQVIRRPGGLTVELSRLVARAGAFCTGPLDLAVRSGEYFVLLGPSGAGKTVVLETIAGLRRPAGGSVGLDGSDAASLPPERRRIGFVCQDSLLFPNLDVAGNIAFGLGAHTAAQWVSGTRRRRAAASPRVGAVAGLVGAGHLMSRDPVELSGGEQQRVALARALVTEPRLLLLDEPLANLDQETREELQTMLRRIHEHFPTTVLHVTHDFPEATVLADRCAVLGDGRLHQTGTPSEVFRRPVDAFVARFTGGRNVFSGVGTAPEDRQGALTPADGRGAGLVVATFVELPGGPRLRSATILGGRVGVLVRPEDIEIVPEGGVAPTGDDSLGRAGFNELSGAVEDILHQGGTALVRVAVPPRFTALLTRGQLEALGVQRGDRVRLRIPVAAVHLFPEGERGAETLAAPRSFA
jgi:ABC-type Fe3+/spermidine/putrescine transport system ATPase subunit